MPCNDGGWPARAESYERQSGETQAKLDNVTRMLCEICTVIEEHHPDSAIQQSAGAINGLRGWWDKHQKLDAKRREKERQLAEAAAAELSRVELAKQALNKLTYEERKALGLQ